MGTWFYRSGKQKRQLNEEIENLHGTPIDEELEGEEDAEAEEFSEPPTSRKGKKPRTSVQKKRKGISSKVPQPFMTNYFAPRITSGSHSGMKSSLATKEQKEAVDMAVGRWWFHANIPFNAARSKFYKLIVNAIASIGTEYKMPSYDDLRGRILRNLVEEVNSLMVHYSTTGCSIIADGWTDSKQKTLINFFVYCPQGMLFLKSVDISAIRNNADALLGIFDEVVLSVGLENVVQFITDNDATNKVARKKLALKYGTFYWTACATHCIDLILEDMVRPDLFPKNAETIEMARKVTKFIYNDAHVLNWMRRLY